MVAMNYLLNDKDVDLIRDALRDRIAQLEVSFQKVGNLLIQQQCYSPEHETLKLIKAEIKRCQQMIDDFYLHQRCEEYKKQDERKTWNTLHSTSV